MWIYFKFFIFFPILKAFCDELTIIHNPSSIQFEGHERLDTSTLKELYSACLSFSTEQDTNWDGMKIDDPFSLPNVIVNFVVPNSESFDKLNGQKYPLNPDENLDETFQSILKKASERAAGESPLIKKIILDKRAQDSNFDIIYKDDEFKIVFAGSTPDLPTEDRFETLKTRLGQLADKISAISKDDGQVKFYWIVLTDVDYLLNKDGNKEELENSKARLEENIQFAADKLQALFKNKALITSIATTSYVHEDRVKRSTSTELPKLGDLNLAAEYSEDFPVIFNIILWTCLTLVFSLLAISITIAQMDPGRDSIIYRMTSNRMKKEN